MSAGGPPSELLQEKKDLTFTLMKFQLWRTPPLLRSTDNYIPAVNTARFLKGKKRILIVGDAGGREYRYLSKQDKEIFMLDIAPQALLPNLVVQSIEERTPYEDDFFDGVVMNEVIEHLFRDVDALEEVHRILKPDGILVITVPFLTEAHDRPEYHVRMHSPNTIRRLLERCGFRVREHFCRGIFSRFIQLSPIFRAGIYFTIKLVEITLKRDADQSTHMINGIVERAERALGQSHWAWIQKISAGYGGILCAEKADKKDFNAVQVNMFENIRLF